MAYSYAEDVLEPGLIHVIERWRDRAALDRHFAAAHIEAWRAAWPVFGIGDRALTLHHGRHPSRPDPATDVAVWIGRRTNRGNVGDRRRELPDGVEPMYPEPEYHAIRAREEAVRAIDAVHPHAAAVHQELCLLHCGRLIALLLTGGRAA